MGDDDDRTVQEAIADVRRRVNRRTFVQDITETVTGRLDRRKIAAKFNNLEHAIDELAGIVERLAAERRRKTA